MEGRAATELMLIRHAPALTGGRLCGRTDVPADCSDTARIAALRACLGRPAQILVSPALRCQQTAAALWSDTESFSTDPDLWEQDFGEWEGMALALLPDIGPLRAADLAIHRPPKGESFADLCARIGPALSRAANADGPVAIIAHAGTVRAGLALALGAVPPALAFEIDPLSLTRLRALPGGGWSVISVNETSA
ncbi:MAG: histidine phosphatase family protein [Albidovulum sp.]